jgi:hypothetical protein
MGEWLEEASRQIRAHERGCIIRVIWANLDSRQFVCFFGGVNELIPVDEPDRIIAIFIHLYTRTQQPRAMMFDFAFPVSRSISFPWTATQCGRLLGRKPKNTVGMMTHLN